MTNYILMNISISQSVFPSYNKIRNRLIQQQNADYQHKISQLNTHLTQMQATYNFKQEHDEIKQSILSFAQPPDTTPFFKDPLKVQPAHRYHQSGEFNAESLNYYIGDDGQTDNNYQTYLKFKKKALERDLQEEELQKHENKKQKRKQREEEQEFFKNLYTNSQPAFSQNKVTVRAKSANNKPIKYQQMKENASHFVSSLLKSNLRHTSKPCGLRKTGTGVGRNQQSETQKNAFENNRKYLTENYLQILKKLQNTNIVKWRVLNQ